MWDADIGYLPSYPSSAHRLWSDDFGTTTTQYSHIKMGFAFLVDELKVNRNVRWNLVKLRATDLVRGTRGWLPNRGQIIGFLECCLDQFFPPKIKRRTEENAWQLILFFYFFNWSFHSMLIDTKMTLAQQCQKKSFCLVRNSIFDISTVFSS